METRLSKTQVDRLGERLRGQAFDEADLRMLDEYRRTFGPAYDRVVEQVRKTTGLPVSGRRAKSTTSIIEKLIRESIRLSQMQDIAGCRTIVGDVVDQDRAVQAIASAFEDVSILDRRVKPSHGYRAVHVVVRDSGSAIEIQVRTVLQHLWAEISERFADTVDPAVKYGRGDVEVRGFLDEATELITRIERREARFGRRADVPHHDLARLTQVREKLVTILTSMIEDSSDSPEQPT